MRELKIMTTCFNHFAEFIDTITNPGLQELESIQKLENCQQAECTTRSKVYFVKSANIIIHVQELKEMGLVKNVDYFILGSGDEMEIHLINGTLILDNKSGKQCCLLEIKNNNYRV